MTARSPTLHPKPDTAAFLAAAAAAAFARSGRVPPATLLHLYRVFVRDQVPPKVRRDLLRSLFRTAPLPAWDAPPPVPDDPATATALARDLMLLQVDPIEANEGEPAAGEATRLGVIVEGLLERAALTAPQLAVFREQIRLENRLLRAIGAGEAADADDGDWRELSARAASVGLPLTTLYFAGITGFSAVGLTSGLAAIGTTAGAGFIALGLNPMTAGIAALIGGGVVIKKVADHALGRKQKREEAERARADHLTGWLDVISALSADHDALTALPALAEDPVAAHALPEMLGEALDGLKRHAATAR